jgi:hypothetical protein
MQIHVDEAAETTVCAVEVIAKIAELGGQRLQRVANGAPSAVTDDWALVNGRRGVGIRIRTGMTAP